MKEDKKITKGVIVILGLVMLYTLLSIAFNIGYMFGMYSIATSEVSLKNNAEIELIQWEIFNKSVEYIYINNTPSCELEILKAEIRMFNEYLEKGYLQKVKVNLPN